MPILRAPRRLPFVRLLSPLPTPVVVAPASLETRRLAWARALKELLPPSSVLWTLAQGSYTSLALEALATELARIEGRGLDLLEELDPRTTTELLPEWERLLGLPDGCVVELLETTAERRLVVTEKYTARGGQSANYFIAKAAALGIVGATVNQFHSLVLRAGFRAGERCYAEEWAHVWELDASDRLPAPKIVRVECVNTVDGSLPPGRYYYRVTALNAFGETLGSVERSGVAPAGTSTNVIEVEWGHVPGATSYNVYGRDRRGERYMVGVSEVDAAVDGHKFQDDGSIVPGAFLPTTNTTSSGATNGVELAAPEITAVEWASDTDGGLGAGTWYYRITALLDGGESLPSAEVAGVAGGATTTNLMRVRWNKVQGATGYNIYGRDTGAEGLLYSKSAEDAGDDPFADDDGGTVPGAAVPTTNTTRTNIARTLECRVRKASPAHSLVLFAYP